MLIRIDNHSEIGIRIMTFRRYDNRIVGIRCNSVPYNFHYILLQNLTCIRVVSSCQCFYRKRTFRISVRIDEIDYEQNSSVLRFERAFTCFYFD